VGKSQDDLKQAAAEAALAYVDDNYTVGVGTGSTVNYFIDALATIRHKIDATVASSEASAERLQRLGIPVIDLNAASEVHVYIDGADETTKHLQLIKGGGGALTREKIIAAVAKQFVCVVDETKFVDVLGKFPLPVEVVPMARSYVAREIVKLGGSPIYREGFVTDNGNIILDIEGLDILNPNELEDKLNAITGVVTNGLFAKRPADVLLIANQQGVDKLSI